MTKTTTKMNGTTALLDRWARFAHRRRGRVIGGWVIGLVALVVAMMMFGGSYSNNFKLPGSEAQAGLDLLEQRFPARPGDQIDLVFQAPGGVQSPDTKARIDGLLAESATMPGVASVEGPWEQPGYISKDGTIARAVVHWKTRATEADKGQVKAFLAAVDKTDADAGGTLRIEAGGEIVARVEFPSFGSEFIGLAAAVVILFLAFGSLVAMGLPISAALFGLGAGFAGIKIGANVIDFPDWTAQFVSMIGLGVGIDYSLLVVTRFREGLHSGRNVEDSVALAITTAGRSVVFAGVVVAIAMFGLYAMGLPFIAAVGTGAAIVVLMAVLVALLLMPALLSLIGTRVDKLRVPFLHSTEGVDTSSGWYRLSKAIQRRPLPWVIGAAAFLLVIASPVLGMHLGFTDAGNKPEHYRTRRAYDLLAQGFGPGFNGPLFVVATWPQGQQPDLTPLAKAIAGTRDVAQVAPPVVSPGGDTAIITVIPETSPQDSKTLDLVHRLRDVVVPGTVTNNSMQVYVSGSEAAHVDVGDRIGQRMPFLFGGVIGLSFLLLMTVFRSVLVAVKAALMNLLSIGAAYGVMVAVFQWGWFGGLLGVSKGPIEVFLPMMMFAILFGLSMDYEVFLISRIREEYIRHGDNATAVSHGLAATARVITAAAAIMIAVFLAFVLGEDRIVKELGIGMSTAIFVDATVVRLILVPATMELLGDANWWLPRWLDRLLPNVHIEAAEQHDEEFTATAAGGH